MAVLTFTLSEEGVAAFRDALICLNKFSDDVSLEARKESFVLTTLNNSKSAYASFRFATSKFFSRYQYQASGQFRERFYCNLYIRALISLFRSRSSVDTQRDAEKQTLIERCDVAIEDGEGVKSRFIARIVFRNGLTSTYRLPFEVAVPVHAKFSRQDAPHHWTISSRTLRQLMDHFGPGIEYLDINTDGNHVNFTCFSEKTVSEDAVLKKPLQTSIAVEADEFDDIEVEDKLHIIISVKDFRAIIQHAGSTGNALSAQYSIPARPIQLSYSSDAISCEFLIMTVGERGSNPNQKTKKGRKNAAQNTGPRLEATSGRTSVAPSEAPQQPQPQSATQPMLPAASRPPPPNPTPRLSAARASASRIGAFDLRPSQRPPPPTLRSESLFVDDDGWEPVRDEDEDAEDARLEWDHSADPNPSVMHMNRVEERQTADPERAESTQAESTYLEPTQRLSDVKSLALFPD
ncbi:DNA repair protein rad9 [Tolypocladium ophioglossoides CBS 100239]|uniref:DNA repair protein rad9 n=1 Tax=Tolypocladium ophioglossoides (strain CBS 100239) TaxID=1163406 RepID=A0A0L0N9X0_TOLOC|nr:DNA repair protein rad9 [Tolypocladium ophioglossoides CBS 100239]